MIVSQLMSRNVVTCGPQDRLDTVASKMWDGDIGCLPVVDDDNRVIGMITDRDVCMAAYTQGTALRDIQVASVIARCVFSAKVADSLQDVEALMRAHKVRRIPIVDRDGRIQGVISLNDLIREAASERTRRHPDLSAGEIVTTLATIVEPRRSEALLVAAE